MLFLDDQHDARSLAVEGARGMLDRVSHDLLDLGVRDRGCGGEGVVGAAVGRCGHEGIRGGHCGRCVEVARLCWCFGEEPVVSTQGTSVEWRRRSCDLGGADAGFRRQDLREARERDK